MRGAIVAMALLLSLLLSTACGQRGTTAAPIQPSQATAGPNAKVASDPASDDEASDCPAAHGTGTVDPDIAISSITFVVNGQEQLVRPGDILQASPGDQVRVSTVAICASPVSGDGGQACVDFVPVDQSGQEIAADHAGTHQVNLATGLVLLPGPDRMWIIAENWSHFAAVVNHWPPIQTADLSCADALCEHDDRLVIPFR